PSRVRRQYNFLAYTRNAVAVDHKKHVDARNGLRGQLWRDHTQLLLALCTLLMERELHVAISAREAMGIVITTQHDDRSNVIGIAGDRDIEVPAVLDLFRRVHNGRACGCAALVKQVRREEDLPGWDALVGITAGQHTIRRYQRIRWIVALN